MGCGVSRVDVGEQTEERSGNGGAGKPPHGQAQNKEEDVDALLKADVERIEAERREPLPEGSEWNDWGGDEIEPLLAFIDVIDVNSPAVFGPCVVASPLVVMKPQQSFMS